MTRRTIASLIVVFVCILGLVSEAWTTSEERIEIDEIIYFTPDVARLFIRNIGETDQVKIKSVYVDGRSYPIVTAGLMRGDGRWHIPPGENASWSYVNPGEAFMDTDSVSKEKAANVTVRSLTPFVQATVHEFRVITSAGYVASAKSTASFLLRDADRVELVVISYEDGTKLTIRPDSPDFSEIMTRLRSVLSVVDIVVKNDVDPHSTRYVLVTSGYKYENRLIEERIYFLFDGPYAGQVLTYGSLCCILARSKSSLWAVTSGQPMRELEDYVGSIKPGAEEASNELPVLVAFAVAVLALLAYVFVLTRRSRSLKKGAKAGGVNQTSIGQLVGRIPKETPRPK